MERNDIPETCINCGTMMCPKCGFEMLSGSDYHYCTVCDFESPGFTNDEPGTQKTIKIINKRPDNKCAIKGCNGTLHDCQGKIFCEAKVCDKCEARYVHAIIFLKGNLANFYDDDS